MSQSNADGGFPGKLVLLVLLVLALSCWHTYRVSKRVLEHVISIEFPQYSPSFRFVWANLLGTVSGNTVLMEGTAGSAAGEAILIKDVKVRFSPEDWFQILIARQPVRYMQALSQIAWSFENVNASGLMESTTDFEWFGRQSGALFEAAGCEQDEYWTETDLFRMGLTQTNVDMYFSWEQSENSAIARKSLIALDMTEVEIVRDFKVFSQSSDAVQTLIPLKERWVISDQGFNEIRNRYCSMQQKISISEYLDKHVAAVRDRFATHGLSLSQNTLAIYREYARNGGALTIRAEFAEEFNSLRTKTPEEIVKGVSGEVRLRSMKSLLAPRLAEPVAKQDVSESGLSGKNEKAREQSPVTGLLAPDEEDLRRILGVSLSERTGNLPKKQIITSIVALESYKDYRGRVFRPGRRPEVVRVLGVRREPEISLRVEQKYTTGTIEYTILQEDFIKMEILR